MRPHDSVERLQQADDHHGDAASPVRSQQGVAGAERLETRECDHPPYEGQYEAKALYHAVQTEPAQAAARALLRGGVVCVWACTSRRSHDVWGLGGG